jgi:paraquat-inducible protein B
VKNPALMIGAFVIVALALVVGGILWLSGSHLFETRLRAVMYFQDGVAGLTKGAAVTFRGVPVGQVESIGLEVDDTARTVRIPVHVRLSPDIITFRNGNHARVPLVDLQSAVRDGLRAKLVSQSLVTGQKEIELDMLAHATAVAQLPDGLTEIPVVADRLGPLEDQLAELPLREIVQELRSMMQSFRTTLATANGTLVAADSALVAAGREIGGVGAQARQTLAAASAAILLVQGNADVALTAVTRLADNTNGTVTAIRPDLLRTLSGTRDAAESARVAMARVAELTAPDAPLRSDLDGAVADLAQAARGLRDWSELLQEQPNAIVFGRRRPGKGPP